ncbi:MAG TPA: uroporphyrinogen-III C-methyltransferase [Candidatus Binatia bacterium]|nr:uroporphyrinogen-III C-methyltransferase [Candidatus Binatia bacterium]
MTGRPVPPGRIYIVGAGPGDPELLTLRAAAVLEAADAVFHDRLVSAEVLALVRPGAELVDVGHRAGHGAGAEAGAGKRRGDPEGVVDRMVRRCRPDQVVVRLQGGDPFVFGRGGEELRRLAALGVTYEVVPGLSSALAGPASAGIPVTHLGVAASFAVVTGHGRDPETAIRWHELRADTVVVLMAASRLADLSRQLLDAGWAGDTPAAVVMAATTAAQRQVVAPLAGIAEAAAAAGLGPPSILVVGQVVALAPDLPERLLALADHE